MKANRVDKIVALMLAWCLGALFDSFGPSSDDWHTGENSKLSGMP